MMWESSSTRIGDDDRVTAGILIPYSEIAAPVRWPLLVHELGHHISPGGASSDKLRKEKLGEGGGDASSKDDALSELQADRIAENAVGATYALAMAREGYLLRIGTHSKQGGPTVKQRLEQLTHGADVAAALPDEWHLDGTRQTADGEPEEVMDLEELAELSLLAKELAPIPTIVDNSARVDLARALLREGDPIPSVPRQAVTAADAFERASRHELSPAEVETLFTSVVEDPLSDAEILEAAWMEELDQDDEQILAKLTASTEGKILEQEMADLDADDVRLSRSLQAAAVHRWLLINDTDIATRSKTAEEAPRATAPHSDGSAEWFSSESAPLSDVQMVRRLGLNAGDPRRLVVRPIADPAQVGGTTIDLRLGTEWETLRTSRFRSLDPSDEQAEVTDLLNRSVDEYRLAADDPHGLVLHPGELLLALSLEYLSLPDDLWGSLEGRSTWARLGLQVHATAGMVDAGFRGFLTFELQNTGRLPIVLYPGIRVAQMAFFPVEGIARPYGAKSGAAYANQARVRTAFTSQHEHRARHAYLRREEEAERQRRSGDTG
ncbi:dCTP deaminase [Microbacterium lacticum]|uniref:dCTP deaminase n=1 Tax=Microbacterium lacticum TaxID=33885 RepID=UPI003A8B32E3